MIDDPNERLEQLGQKHIREMEWEFNKMGVEPAAPLGDIPPIEAALISIEVCEAFNAWSRSFGLERMIELVKERNAAHGWMPDAPRREPPEIHPDLPAPQRDMLHRLTDISKQMPIAFRDMVEGSVTIGEAARRDSEQWSRMGEITSELRAGRSESQQAMRETTDKLTKSAAGKAVLAQARSLAEQFAPAPAATAVPKLGPRMSIIGRRLQMVSWMLNWIGVRPDPPVEDAKGNELGLVTMRVRQAFEAWKRPASAEEAKRAEVELASVIGLPEGAANVLRPAVRDATEEPPRAELHTQVTEHLRAMGFDADWMERHRPTDAEADLRDEIDAATHAGDWALVRAKTDELLARRDRSEALRALARKLSEFEDGLPKP